MATKLHITITKLARFAAKPPRTITKLLIIATKLPSTVTKLKVKLFLEQNLIFLQLTLVAIQKSPPI
jgi:hypothetical protein